MKKQLILAIVLAGMLVGAEAFATVATESVMGQGGNETFASVGSFAYDTEYNIFYNPAYLNDVKNVVVFEKNNLAGFSSAMYGFNLGVFLHRPNAFGTNYTSVNKHPVDIMIAGDHGVKWGLGVTYDNKKGKTTGNDTDMAINAGVKVAGFDPYVNFIATGKNDDAATEVKHSGFTGGLRYHYGEWTPYAAYSSRKVDTSVAATTNKYASWVVGLGRTTKLSEGARLNYALYHISTKNKDGNDNIVSNGVASSATPLEMSIETDANSWFTLRAGVHYVLINDQGDTTSARIGGTFHAGKANIDFAFGNGGNEASADATHNVGFDSSTFGTVAVTYAW